MHDNSLQHHGVKGQKWGVRRYQNKDGSLTTAGKHRQASSKKESVKDLSDDELRKRIKRLQDEKTYKDLMKSEEKQKLFDGKKFVVDVLKRSGENIATQATTYAMGVAVNKAFGKNIVNPKKGQKDK